MKKFLSIILALSMMLSVATVVVAEDNIKVTIDGVPQSYDVMPVLDNDRTLVPMRGIFEALGAEISWEEATETVTGVKGDITVVLQIGNTTAKVNGVDIILDVPAKLINDRTMVPVRFISESLGCNVDWEDATQTVIITSPAEKHMLDGKKVIFIGNSFIHYGRTVASVNKKSSSFEDRQDTQGGLVQLCKANGIDISVTNWTISSHKLSDLMGSKACTVCKNGIIHEEKLTDKYFDYVFFSPASSATQESEFLSSALYIEETFKALNPNVKIVCIGNIGAYGHSSTKHVWTDLEKKYASLEERGIKVVDWGNLVKGVVSGKYKVPGAKETYTESTFLVKDNYHPNLLTGYITTLMAYCIMTGESAVGQPYNYIFETSLAPTFDLPSYVDYYYTNGDADTNFPEILASESEIKGIQQLVDQYLSEKSYR